MPPEKKIPLFVNIYNKSEIIGRISQPAPDKDVAKGRIAVYLSTVVPLLGMLPLRQLPWSEKIPGKRMLFLSAVIFLAAFGLRVYHLNYRSIWMDEDAQAHHADVGWQPELVFRAARQQQPPLDYALEKIGLVIFGWTEIGARIHAAMLGSAASVLFFLLLKDLGVRRASVFLGTLLFVTHPMLVRYSQEGRPVSCGVFFCVLFIRAALGFLNRTFGPGRRFLRQAAPLFVSSVLFLLSTGFQPIVFLIVFIVAVFAASSLFRVYDKSARRLLAVVAAAFLAVLPILLLCLGSAGAYLGSTSFVGRVAAVITAALEFDVGAWLVRLNELMGHVGLFFVALLPLSATGITVEIRNGTMGKNAGVGLGLFFMLALLYPLVFNALYYGLVPKHALTVRYYATVIPALLILLTLLVNQAEIFVASRLRRFSPRVRYGFRFGILVAAALVLLPTVASLREQYFISDRTDWRGFYQLLKEDKKTFGVAYLMNLIAPGKWGPPRFYATRFYYPEDEVRPVLLRKVDSLYDDLDSGLLAAGNFVYLAVPYGREALSDELLRKSGAEFFKFTKLSVVRVKLGDDPTATLLKLFNHLDKKMPKIKSNYKIYEVQAFLKILTGDLDGAAVALERLEALDDKGILEKNDLPILRGLLSDSKSD